jgi:uncharacterized protein (TIGR03083 family)
MNTEHLEVLRGSVTRLRAIVEGFDAEHLRRRAYPAQWTVADVLSHLGSGAVIMHARLDAGLGGPAFSDDMAPPIWDEWNAKSPDAKVADGLAADRALLERFDAVIDDAAGAEFHLGPLTVDLEGLIDLRLNEHVLHTWDVEVVLDPNATVPAGAAAVVIDNLDLMVRFTGKPTGSERDLHVHTVDPARDFRLSLGKDAVALGPYETNVANPVGADVELSADALIRIVYGRFDADHASPVRADIDVDELRRAFPGP